MTEEGTAPEGHQGPHGAMEALHLALTEVDLMVVPVLWVRHTRSRPFHHQ